MSSGCPLCGSQDNELIEQLDPEFIATLYKTRFGIDLAETAGRRVELRVCADCDLRFYNPAWAAGERLYAKLQQFDWYYLEEKEEYGVAAPYVSENCSVLEIGAGFGAFSEKVQAKSYVGLELSDSAVAFAQQRGLFVYKSSIEEHAENLRNPYDVVCAFQVLEHVPNTRSFVEASLRCLKAGGKLIYSVPSEDSFPGKEVNNMLNMPPHHMTRWTDTALLRLGELFGLTVLEIRHDSLSDHHIRPHAVAQVRNYLTGISGSKHRSLDPRFAKFFAKVLVRSIAVIPEIYLRAKRSKLRGHSVTAIYEKKQVVSD